MNLVIGSRGSDLALWQSAWARSVLTAAHPDLSVEIEVIRTTGDANLSDSFKEIGGKGVFTREVDEALLAGRTDFSVHSLKDLPTTFPDGLQLTAVSPREDVRDALIASDGSTLAALRQGARVATSSLRRQALLRSERPDLDILPLRGNVGTRIRKLETQDLDAIVLAGAGLKRLGLDGRVTEYLDPDRFIPAAGQGVMAIVSRVGDDRTADLLSVLEDKAARAAVTAERSALAELGGGCRIPFGAWARAEDGGFVMDGVVGHPEREGAVRARVAGEMTDAEAMGKSLAEKLLNDGGDAILSEVLA